MNLQVFELGVPQDMRHLFDWRSEVSYTPDFFLPLQERYIEIKGDWMSGSGERTMAKIILFKRENPNRELELIDIHKYRKLEREYKEQINNNPRFVGWECGSRKKGYNLATNPKDFLPKG